MGPKKAPKVSIQFNSFNETRSRDWSTDEPVNSNSWRCVVSLCVEKSESDTYALKEFMEESIKGRRQEVTIIDYEVTILKILHDFANGELPYKYKFLLNFSSLFQEAVEYTKNRLDVPTNILVKIVKVLLFFIKEENLIRLQNMAGRSTDPIKAMAERPSYFGENEKKKDVTKKGGNGLKVRPPSITKLDTKLLKRGERAKDDQCIDDAPRNAYFDHYVILTGFYNPEFPLELLKADVPLHGVLCIDTSRSGVKWEVNVGRISRRNTETRAREINGFWKDFLKTVWDPEYSYYFRDTVFQMYVPKRALCEKESLRKFLYKEISYLMYDLSDLQRQLNNYLSHIHLWHMREKDFQPPEFLGPNNIANEFVSVPIMLQCIINSLSQNEMEDKQFSFTSSEISSQKSWGKFLTPSLQATQGSAFATHDWNIDLEERGEYSLLNLFYKIKELDQVYELEKRDLQVIESGMTVTEASESEYFEFPAADCGENLEKALLMSDTIFHMLWRNHKHDETCTFSVDYCFIPSLMTRVVCSYRDADTEEEELKTASSYTSTKKNFNFETIEFFGPEMRKPHFTITEGSRSIINSQPYNIKSASRDFFCPKELKIVSPEKLKASSAPQFRVTAGFKVQSLYTSEIFAKQISKNPYENLKGFVADCMFSSTNDFDVIEFLSKPKLLQEEKVNWRNYNCIDNVYCAFNDTILLMLHSRTDGQNFQHETFNQKLRTPVGLRDFYEYVQEDEAEWLAVQEESYQAKVFLSNKVIESNSLRDFSDSDFWLANSLKHSTMVKRQQSMRSSNEVKIAYSSLEKIMKPMMRSFQPFVTIDEDELEGYDLGTMAVQYSGLKTVFYSEECSVAVQLIERLYGNQDLSVQVTQAGHTLYLHSYVCPEPHLFEPFTFHVMYQNGIILAFGRRLMEVFEESEGRVESPTSGRSRSRRNSKMVKDPDFLYDMGASFPNGLCIRTVRTTILPCYIKQYYVGNTVDKRVAEKSRLFLPSGEVIKMMRNGTVQIIKPNTSIVTADLNDLITDEKTGKLIFSKYKLIMTTGMSKDITKDSVMSSFRYQTFKHKDSSTNKNYFCRRDGTDYLLQNDGSICVQFKDGTKLSSTPFVVEKRSASSFDILNEEFVHVHVKFVAEHPDYATVIFNTDTMIWEILLPNDSSLTIYPEGNYSVQIDTQVQLKVDGNEIHMNQFCKDGQVKCNFTADLSVFEDREQIKYCQMKDSAGKVFVVERNSNCYLMDSKMGEDETLEFVLHPDGTDIELSEFIASTDLQNTPSWCVHKRNDLCRENKYFVVKRDLTGLQVHHVDDANKIMRKKETGTLLYVQDLPGTDARCFVMISPVVKKKSKKWQVKTILPNPKYDRNANKVTVSSTYGVEFPPTWLHPFPKKKKKFLVPETLSCRAFVETKRTTLSPTPGSLDCTFYDIEEVTEIKYCNISPGGVEEYMRRLANDNQNMLKEMYTIVAATIINEKKRLKPNNSEKLEQYLKRSKYTRDMIEFYKKSIRFKAIPKYFEHPRGMSWLIINSVVNCIRSCYGPTESIPPDIEVDSETTQSSSGIQTYSYRELEYDLSVSGEQSFSSLSYRSNLSGETAPAILRTVGVKCKVQPVRVLASCPEIMSLRKQPDFRAAQNEESETELCTFRQEEIDFLTGPEPAATDKPAMCFEDLMYLGFI